MKRVLIIGGIGLLVLSALLLMGGLIQFILPPVYESVARIAMTACTGVDQWDLTSSEPFPAAREIERLQSKSVLYQVITNLDLNQRWSEKFMEGALGTETTYALVKGRLKIRQTPGNEIIEIRVESDDPAEAAAIANGIAMVRLEQRSAGHRELFLHGIEALTSEAQTMTANIHTLEEQLKQLEAKLNLAVDAPQPPRLEKGGPQVESIKLRRELDVLRIAKEKLMARLEEERIHSLMCKLPGPQLIDAAVPERRPIRPHPVMKVIVLIAGLLAGITGVVLLLLDVMRKSSIKQPPPLQAK